jgi:hypothetical protein
LRDGNVTSAEKVEKKTGRNALHFVVAFLMGSRNIVARLNPTLLPSKFKDGYQFHVF